MNALHMEEEKFFISVKTVPILPITLHHLTINYPIIYNFEGEEYMRIVFFWW
jgi:hypothetical protein